MEPSTLCIDMGGTAIKVMLFHGKRRALSERIRVKTPHPATPHKILKVLDTIISKLSFDRISVGFPGVILKGVPLTAPNLSPAWKDFRLEGELTRRYKCPVRVINDADMQGLGAISGSGTELVLTLGTGVGSALFHEGMLFPNLELGHHPFRKGQTYEEQLGKAALELVGERNWNHRIRRALSPLKVVFNFDLLYFGGGNSERIRGKLPAFVRRVENDCAFVGGLFLWYERAPSRKLRMAA